MRISERGFTLLEVLLGLAITSVVLVLLLAALDMGRRSQDKGLLLADLSQRTRIITDRLHWLIAGAYPYQYPDDEDESVMHSLFRGTSTEMAFVTTSTDGYSGAAADLAGLKYVRLFTGPDGLQMEEMIFFLGALDDPPDGETFVFGPEVSKVEFEYLDHDLETGETRWVGSWSPDENTYLPQAVSARLTLMHRGGAVDLPRLVVKLRAGGSEGLAVPEEFRTGNAVEILK